MTKTWLVHYYITRHDHRFTKVIEADSFAEAVALAHEIEPLCRVERLDEREAIEEKRS